MNDVSGLEYVDACDRASPLRTLNAGSYRARGQNGFSSARERKEGLKDKQGGVDGRTVDDPIQLI
jgi:hypothetical protein